MIPEGGLAFWVTPDSLVDWDRFSQKMAAKGIEIVRPETYSYQQEVNGIRLGYGSLSERELEEAIIALSEGLS